MTVVCGICGIYRYGSTEPLETGVLERMAGTLSHRGPDAAGTYMNPDRRVGFGFRRLSIIDLSPAGNQPMANEDGTVWIVFNGEIYNHVDHRPALEARGHVYRSRADTETILHLYEEYGPDCVHHLRGMFAFAIWDERHQRLFLARDRIGVKPLYYAQRGGTFFFASEIKAILSYPGIERDVNPEALSHYLTLMIPPAPLTLFKEIFKLPAGYRMTVDRNGHVVQEQYWDAVVPSEGRVESEEYYVERIRELLQESVRLRMMSDVPVGVFLSGGMDSSTNVALMARCTDRPINTFSVGFKTHDKYNELEFARKVAREFGTNHHEILIDHSDTVSYLPELIYSQDEPIADWVCVPLYFVSKLLRDSGVIVVQVGEGADELFCGYPHYLHSLWWQRQVWPWLAHIPRVAWRLGMEAMAAPVVRGLRFPQRARRLFDRALDGSPPFWGGAVVFRGEEKRRLLDTPFWRSTGFADSGEIPRQHYAHLLAVKPEADPLERMIYLELKHRLPELLLMRVDKVTMSTSVEARVPFLDHQLVEFAMTIPMLVKVADGQTKAILKKAVDGIIPQEIIHRPKQGFAAPVREWFRGELAKMLRNTVLESVIHKRGYFNRPFIRMLVDEHQAGRRDASVQLWTLFNLALWYERWIVGI